MKNFKVSANVKGIETSINIEAIGKEEARQEARKKLGYEMRGVFFPLHWSEITACQELK